jgi:glycosyltransferase involved in cell wall biosynthesis
MSAEYDVVCLSHLRWDFVFQRPQHLLTRCACERAVLFVEEPTFGAKTPHLDITSREGGVEVVVPRLPDGRSSEEISSLQQQFLDVLLARRMRRQFILWYYTPMALMFSRHLHPVVRVYDCMDELANFQGAPPQLRSLERELLASAELVFTGGTSLYEAKRAHHPNVHAFPSSVDVPHFAAARTWKLEPPDQASIPHPRLGYFGVIDERMDLALLDALAQARPDWQLVMLGQVAKIDPATLPRHPNIHWLGSKTYQELPRYIAGWDVALLPFARTDATRFISPTKTPEYLAAGKPVVSTPIRDVVCPYGEMGLVSIASTPNEFIDAVAQTLISDGRTRQQQADGWLSRLSWDRTWGGMRRLIDAVVMDRGQVRRRPIIPAAASSRLAPAGSPTNLLNKQSSGRERTNV